jgi:hypothetical protein
MLVMGPPKHSLYILYYLGSFDTTYIILRIVEIFRLFFSNKKKIVNGNIESSRILYFSK